MLRKLIRKFHQSITERVVSPRKTLEVPIKVWIKPDKNTGRLKLPLEHLYIAGETKDVSRTGIAFEVPSIRIQENYLVGQGRVLNAEVDLPQGKIRMQVVGRRYEQVGEHVSASRYLIGAEIVEISSEDLEAYEYLLRYGTQHKKGSLELGIDKG